MSSNKLGVEQREGSHDFKKFTQVVGYDIPRDSTGAIDYLGTWDTYVGSAPGQMSAGEYNIADASAAWMGSGSVTYTNSCTNQYMHYINLHEDDASGNTYTITAPGPNGIMKDASGNELFKTGDYILMERAGTGASGGYPNNYVILGPIDYIMSPLSPVIQLGRNLYRTFWREGTGTLTGLINLYRYREQHIVEEKFSTYPNITYQTVKGPLRIEAPFVDLEPALYLRDSSLIGDVSLLIETNHTQYNNSGQFIAGGEAYTEYRTGHPDLSQNFAWRTGINESGDF